MAEKNVFDGSDVTDAIKKACAKLGVAQEELNIEVVRTGTSGIFGLMRRSAQIKVSLKEETVDHDEATPPVVKKKGAVRPAPAARGSHAIKTGKEFVCGHATSALRNSRSATCLLISRCL